MTSERTIKMAISKSNLQAALHTSGLLDAVGAINDFEQYEITLDIPDVVPMQLKITREVMETTRHG